MAEVAAGAKSGKVVIRNIGLLLSGAHIIAGSLGRPAEWRQTV